ncbi:MAG: exo-alpha-sialidase [Planctomycetes bacterium]|nr:exo-alpha-sialidase [Planctomycetota bacterium]
MKNHRKFWAVALTHALVPVVMVLTRADASGDGNPATDIDVFVSGKEGYHTFRIPSLLVTPKGTLLAFCEGRKTSRSDHGDVDLVLKRSGDGGKTWGPLELVYEAGDTAKITIGNPCPVVDRDTGVIWLPFCRDNRAVFVTHSRDDGKTWARPVNITAAVTRPGWSWVATGPGVGIQLAKGNFAGRLVIPCDHKVKAQPGNAGYHSHIIYSDDHGKTWQLGGAAGPFTNECQVVELGDSSLMLNMRNYHGDKDRSRRRAVAFSKDGGQTWSDSRYDDALIEPICQGSLHRHGKSLVFSNPASTRKRERLTIRLSHDDGKTWPESMLIHEGAAAYSCLATLPDGRIGVLFERDDYRALTFVALRDPG